MYNFKSLSLFISLAATVTSFVSGFPVSPVSSPHVGATGLDVLAAVLAGVSHHVETPRGLIDGLALVGSNGNNNDDNSHDANTIANGIQLLSGNSIANAPSVSVSELVDEFDVDAYVRDLESTDVRPAGHALSVPEIFHGAIIKIQPIVASLKASVAVKANIEIDLVVSLLNDILIVVGDVVVDLQAILDDPVPVVLGLADHVLTLPQVAYLVASLVYLIAIALHVVVAAVATLGISATAVTDPIVAEIGGVLANVISLSLHAVGGLGPLLSASLKPIVQLLVNLHIGQVVAVLGISAPLGVNLGL